jgi:glyoxylase-like metal-dependent hydrolase (beta-lactamase superfamily II)
MLEAKPKQASGFYRRRVGDAMVTVINDGFLDMPMAILRGATHEEMKDLLKDAFGPPEPRITVNAFVIETEKNTILVDAGGGSTTVYSMGLMPENLAAAGFQPEDFDTVLVTHIHPDHTSGLIAKDGSAMFPRADIVLHDDDFVFWSDPGLRDGHSPAATPYLGSAELLLKTYQGRFRRTTGGAVVPGITQLHLPGHTPGHSGYQLESAGQTLVMWGDTVHVPELQIPRPGVTSEYDISEAMAAESRRKIFDYVASERLLVTGGHLHLPAFAHVVPAGNGFRLVPEPWMVTL